MALSIGGSRRHSSHRGGPSSGGASIRPPPNLINSEKNKIPPILDEKLSGHHPRLKNGTVVDLSGASGSTSLPPGSNHRHPHHHHRHHNHHRSDTFKCFAFECNCFVAYLLLGLMGFVIFWSILMLRVYLPERYWRWSYIWPSTRNPPQPPSTELSGLLASGDRS